MALYHEVNTDIINDSRFEHGSSYFAATSSYIKGSIRYKTDSSLDVYASATGYTLASIRVYGIK